jgi:Arc/MetJ family transcription regulator
LKKVTRTNVVIEDELIERVMSQYRFRTKREAVDYALRRLVSKYEPKDMLDLEGMGWGGDLEAMRRKRYPDGYLDAE